VLDLGSEFGAPSKVYFYKFYICILILRNQKFVSKVHIHGSYIHANFWWKTPNVFGYGKEQISDSI
jgi:hypothetical protein